MMHHITWPKKCLKPTTKFLVLFYNFDVFINLSRSSFNHLICVKQQEASVECHSSLLSFSQFVLKPICSCCFDFLLGVKHITVLGFESTKILT